MLHSVFPGCRFVFYRCERVCSSPNSIGRPSLYADSQDLNKALLLSSCPNKCSASQLPLLSLASKVLTARQPSVPIFKSSFSRSTRHNALLEKKTSPKPKARRRLINHHCNSTHKSHHPHSTMSNCFQVYKSRFLFFPSLT